MKLNITVLTLCSLVCYNLAGISLAGISLIASVPLADAADLGDYDRDGVINARDKCPGTKPLLQVDQYGCQQLKVVTQTAPLDIPFKHGSAYIHPKYYPEIEKIAQELRRYQGARLILEGHTSVKGTEEVNRKMSIERAKRVANVLIDEYRIAPTRITILAAVAKKMSVLEDALLGFAKTFGLSLQSEPTSTALSDSKKEKE